MLKLSELRKINLKPLGNLVAFSWLISKKTKSGFILPDKYFALDARPGETDGFRLGHYYVGQVEAIGTQVKSLRVGDKILVHEYGIKNFEGQWKENVVYFIEENLIKAKVKLDKKETFEIQRITSSKEYEDFKKVPLKYSKGKEPQDVKPPLDRGF